MSIIYLHLEALKGSSTKKLILFYFKELEKLFERRRKIKKKKFVTRPDQSKFSDTIKALLEGDLCSLRGRPRLK